MSICKTQLRSLITRTLRKIPEFYSADAIELMLMTCAAETDLGHFAFYQNKGGVAKGIMQVEPDTMRDNYGSFLYFRDRLREDIRVACGVDKFDEEALEYNVAFNIFMARLKYFRDPSPIPSDLTGMAKYHKRVYNAGGSANWETTLAKYHHFVGS